MGRRESPFLVGRGPPGGWIGLLREQKAGGPENCGVGEQQELRSERGAGAGPKGLYKPGERGKDSFLTTMENQQNRGVTFKR